MESIFKFIFILINFSTTLVIYKRPHKSPSVIWGLGYEGVFLTFDLSDSTMSRATLAVNSQICQMQQALDSVDEATGLGVVKPE
jgi:hypothetical protein